MISNVIDDIQRDRATFTRDAEYLKETAYDDIIDERLEVAESQYIRESVEELQEAADLLDQLSADVDTVNDIREVENIMNATGTITFEEMTDTTEAEEKCKKMVNKYEYKLILIQGDNVKIQKILSGIKHRLCKDGGSDSIKKIFKETKKLIAKQKLRIKTVQSDLSEDLEKCDCPVTKEKLRNINDELQKCSEEIGEIDIESYND